jgi:cysteine desulfurase
MSRVYLDHNASAWPLPAASQAAATWMLEHGGNPSSVHALGRRARAAVESARRSVAAALGARPAEVVFTSGATEALHLAILGLARPGGHAVVSGVEHPAVFGACRVAGVEPLRIAPDAAGRLAPDAFGAAVRADTAFVAVMAAQNEIGNVYAVEAIARAVAPVPLIVDAVQWFGRLPLDVASLGAAAVVVSGHKIGAPPGVGALWVQPGLALTAFLDGGAQERGRRGGTENVPGIIGFGVAAEAVPDRLAAGPRIAALRDACAEGLRALAADVVFHGDPAARLPNTLSFRLPGVMGDVLLAALDLEGFCLSSGSACASGALEASPVLRALGIPEADARGAIRLSLGPETTEAEVASFLAVLPVCVARIRAAEAEAAGYTRPVPGAGSEV